MSLSNINIIPVYLWNKCFHIFRYFFKSVISRFINIYVVVDLFLSNITTIIYLPSVVNIVNELLYEKEVETLYFIEYSFFFVHFYQRRLKLIVLINNKLNSILLLNMNY